MIESVLVVGIVVACTVWYMQHKLRQRALRRAAQHDPTGIELLTRRYARGEIDRAEFLERRADILGYPSAARPPTGNDLAA